MSTSDANPMHRLSNGQAIPALGLGVWQVASGAECERAVLAALERGYRLIDTAQAYRNERSVGKAFRDSGIPREEIFLTTKYYPGGGDPVGQAQQSLERLGTDYVDLYLVHWPTGGPTIAWPGMEEALANGYARGIGVSNFDTRELSELMNSADVPPVVNQIQLSPFEYRAALLDACREADVLAQAYSPLGTGRHLNDATVARLARSLDRTPAQVLIRWAIEKGTSVIPKSVHADRIDENFDVLDFQLDESAMAALDALDTTRRTGTAMETRRKWWT